MRSLGGNSRSLHLEQLELRQLLTAAPLDNDDALADAAADAASIVAAPQLTAEESHVAILPASSPAAADASYWAETRGVYLFSLSAYQGVWAPNDWTPGQWETWLDTMEYLGLNHLQLMRAPWSERPAETPYEFAKEELWIDVLQSAKARGMTTSLVFGTTWHGDPSYAWKILSPGNSPADPNWQTLLNDYTYWANRYGQWVDEWVMGAEDPGGSPSSAGISYPYDTPSPLGDVSTVTDLVSLQLAMRTAAQNVNPSARLVAETWGLDWWGLTPGYASHLDEFLANVSRYPSDVSLSANGLNHAITDALQATGRDVDAWTFFLIDHEFPVGHTKLHFNWTRSYLEGVRNQGIDDVVAHISHPLEQLPSLYVYSRMLEDPSLGKMMLLQEFSALLTSTPPSQTALASAISNLGLFWDSVSDIANWNAATLQPVNDVATLTPKYSATQLGYLNSALSNINAVTAVRSEAQIPMSITPTAWIEMLRDQIQFLHDAAYIGQLLPESVNFLNGKYAELSSLDSLSRAEAEEFVELFHATGAIGALQRMETYLAQFWPTTTGQNHPLGIIYDFLRTRVPDKIDGTALVAGDFLEYDAPGFDPIFKQLTGRLEENDASFSYAQASHWTVDSSSGHSNGSAIKTSTANSEVNIIFSGRGVTLLHSMWSQGGIAEWSIDGGAGGSGIIDMNSATRFDQVETLLASGLAQTLHLLTIKKVVGSTGEILLDGIVVDDGNRLRREDDRGMLNFAGAWSTTTAGTPSGGSWQYSIDANASIAIPFTGTAVAVTATMRGDYGVMAWSIDGGAGGSGVINLGDPRDTYRKTFILTNSLAGGAHTLTLTKQSGFLINLDAIDTAIETSADFNGDGVTDGADFLAWQRGFGSATSGSDRSTGDANLDGVVDGHDLTIWKSQAGRSGATTSPSSFSLSPRSMTTSDDASYAIDQFGAHELRMSATGRDDSSVSSAMLETAPAISASNVEPFGRGLEVVASAMLPPVWQPRTRPLTGLRTDGSAAHAAPAPKTLAIAISRPPITENPSSDADSAPKLRERAFASHSPAKFEIGDALASLAP